MMKKTFVVYVLTVNEMLRSVSNTKINWPAVIWGTCCIIPLPPLSVSKGHDIDSSGFVTQYLRHPTKLQSVG